MRSILSNLRQVLLSRGFLTAMLGTVGIVILSSLDGITTAFRSKNLQEYGLHAELLLNALSSETMILALPILCSLPYTTSFVDDIKSGFIKEYLPRTTIRHYLANKICVCGLSGGLSLSLGILIAYSILVLLFTPIEAEPIRNADAPVYIALIMCKVILFFGSGSFWAIVGMLFATLTKSKYMAYASPFVTYYILIILYERYIDSLYILYPKEWILPSDVWVFDSWGVVILILELTAIVSLFFCIAAKRRLQSI